MNNFLNAYRRYACDVNRVNTFAMQSPKEFIAAAEASFAQEIQFVAQRILENNCNIVMLSGPSGSGKTTTAQKLCEVFEKYGKHTVMISLDNFYLGEEKVPKNSDGEPDFESVYALDIPYIQKCMRSILAHESCVLPRYDFTRSCRSDVTVKADFHDGAIAVLEGIHALNPVITSGISIDGVAKVYVSVKQGIKDGEKTILSNRDIRFVRRIVRDYEFRRVSPERMADMWESVCDGEQKYIRPYRYQSDFTVNTIHIYEPCVMRSVAVPLLESVSPQNEKYDFVSHILSGLNRFETLPRELIPENSLITEFIGGGCYTY